MGGIEVGASRALLPELARMPGHLVWRANARVLYTIASILPPGVDLHSYATLLALGNGVTRSQQQLSDTISVSRTTMVKVAADLSARGLVTRVRNPDDRRSYGLTRTPEGTEAARVWRRHTDALERSLTACFSTEERDELHDLLDRIVGHELSPDLPRRVRASIGFLITRVHFRMHREFLNALEPHGIEPRHFGALTAIESRGPAPQAELARNLGVSAVSIVSMVDELEAKGLVERQRLDTDRRNQVLYLLPQATSVLAEARKAANDCLSELFVSLEPGEIDRLVELLARFVTAP